MPEVQPKMKISREDVLRVAELAHLELTEAEVDLYRGQLDAILSYMDKLNQLDIAAIEPMAQVLHPSESSGSPELREDTLWPCEVGQAVLKGAPDSRGTYFRVPKVIER
jgi:aspartyl-tRNA(Asn)/glutamyl-tRNA(Gln) amidotransferase subunit C